MFDFLASLRTTPQTSSARADQVTNGAGGFVFALDPWSRLERFLVLGCDGGTYYATERALVVENAKSVDACLTLDGPRAVELIAAFSESGRAPKNDPAVFALAMAAAHPDDLTRRAAFTALPRVCRTATHLFHFVSYVEGFRGWGRALRRAVGDWYGALPRDKLAYQVTKYAQRDGWSHRDLLRLAHPKAPSPAHAAVYRWVTAGGAAGLAITTKKGGPMASADLPSLCLALEAVQRAKSAKEVVRLVREHGLSHEMIPTEWKHEHAVWDALLPDMPLSALLRNLGAMSSIGFLRTWNHATRLCASRLTDARALTKARIHPLSILSALKTYESGKGARGKLSWAPAREIVDALDQAFYLAFQAVVPANLRFLLALDVSGSMSWGTIAGLPGITPRIGSAAMALVTQAIEPMTHIVGFSHRIEAISIGKRTALADAIAIIERVPMGATDCAQPILYAMSQKLPVDVFVVYTDNETFCGPIHPFEALKQYRQKTGIAAKLVVVGMTATGFTIADPRDAGMLDLVGFDAAAPQILSAFAA